MNKKVIVGMSGGVDSTVAAALLKKEGYKVEGVFLEFWKDEKSESGFKSAKRMAEILEIPIKKINAEDEFKKKVVDEFIIGYKSGSTPNPCIICNPRMKFEVLLKEVKDSNADFIATGHYVNIKNGKLFKAKDKTKDQSYFLHGLKLEQLGKVIFPLGKYLKSQTREIARDMNLQVADRDESQDICFVSQNNFEDFLKEHIKDNPGEIRDTSGKKLGSHKGLHFYTIGQRKGVNIGGDGPYYVVKKDVDNNILTVSNNEGDQGLLKDSFEVRDINWISENVEFPIDLEVKVRYHSDPVHATIELLECENKKLKEFKVKLDDPQRAITPGQSAVFYKGGEVFGGGIIV